MAAGLRVLFLLVLFFALAATGCSEAFGWFLRREAAGSPTPSPSAAGDPQPLFEMTAVDAKFVSEGRQLDLSLLDSCHHQVIAQLTTSCSDLSEEELAKLGVSLFNCQAAAEHRLTYPCTADMTLAECTEAMDPDTWNAYHIVSNRARSVCYATRQQDFKKRTEMTVNSLVASASSQLEAMKMLKDGQKELRELTASSLEKVVKSQNELLEQQEQLQGGQQELETSINGNLEKLTKEKELIASGHQQVAKLIEGITLTMENVTKQLAHQDSELQEGHRAILTDLLEVRARAHQVYTKLDSNLALFSAHQSQTAIYYDQLMEKLQKMNQTVGMVMYMIDHLELGVSQRLNSIQHFLSWTGNNLHVIYTCTVHVSYFLVAALIMTFLQTPSFSRAVLLILVVLNALSKFNHCVSMDFKCLSLFLSMTVIDVNFLRKVLPPTTEPGFYDYLRDIDTSAVTLRAVPEGSVVFPKVTEWVWVWRDECDLVATNAARFRLAAGPGKRLLEFGLRRAQGPDGGLSASRYSYIGGFDGTSNVIAGKLYGIPLFGSMAHSYIASFTSMSEVKVQQTLKPATEGEPEVNFVSLCEKWLFQVCHLLQMPQNRTNSSEFAAFISYAMTYPGHFIALVDSYSVMR
ncbi:nicotinate phosphoribosyltransferase [Rhincodon typus]|uniref:nicotinate phosphoribosyltransferase n=1 Tax=Rhincodon typus TaxID=259920 RepID=UPI00202E6B5C|nr:nicotinate phosphoribosyltransferase [Rhincodon typus]